MKFDLKMYTQMRPFLTTKRKLYELLVLLGLNLGLYFVFQSWAALMLFNLGFVWNWAASQPLSYVLENSRYRFSLMKMVYNLHSIVQLPFKKLHPLVSIFPRILPAGLFWYLVIHFAESTVPVWPTFLGSLFFELTQLDAYFVKKAPPITESMPEEVIPAPEFPQDPMP